jgi:transposase
MHLRDVLSPGVKIGAGSFNHDARGRWYINLPIELECASETPNKRIGIDLGLKALATPRRSQLASHWDLLLAIPMTVFRSGLCV